tara:strand:- start:146871 stop:147986 length:1116 start_codon:yes stop_codon:yes gene_type:complete
MFISTVAQEGIRNVGMLKIHTDGGMGFHTDLINDGNLDDNQGLAGFYGNNSIKVSGIFSPIFNDIEILVTNTLTLNVAVGVENHTNFILGNVTTPRINSFIALNMMEDSYYTGSSDISKVDGYVMLNKQQNFIFPVGDQKQLRPLILNSESINTVASCAYYYEDPNNPSTFIGSFNTNSKELSLDNISTREFWRLDGSILSSIQISWNERSAINLLTDNINYITIVGWSISRNQWESLGGNIIGDFLQGLAISDNFIPNEYEVFSFGTTKSSKKIIDLSNYLVTPNGDGNNDFLEIPELELFPNNHIRIYARNGQLVFDRVNYTNEFNGFATEGDVVINQKRGLPSGVYFYLVTLDDLNMEYQGFLYLKND